MPQHVSALSRERHQRRLAGGGGGGLMGASVRCTQLQLPHALSGGEWAASCSSCRKNDNHVVGHLQAAFTGNKNPFKALSERRSPQFKNT